MMPQHFPDILKVVSCAYLAFPLFWSKRATKEVNKEDQVTLIRQRHS
jgi:hypothetical protein